MSPSNALLLGLIMERASGLLASLRRPQIELLGDTDASLSVRRPRSRSRYKSNKSAQLSPRYTPGNTIKRPSRLTIDVDERVLAVGDPAELAGAARGHVGLLDGAGQQARVEDALEGRAQDRQVGVDDAQDGQHGREQRDLGEGVGDVGRVQVEEVLDADRGDGDDPADCHA